MHRNQVASAKMLLIAKFRASAFTLLLALTLRQQVVVAQPCSGRQDLGTLGGVAALTKGMSADGSIVVGRASNPLGNFRAFRWRVGGQLQDLGTLGGPTSEAVAISANGEVVVGTTSTENLGESKVFRWTIANGMQDLGALGAGPIAVTAVSGDGSVIVGSSPTPFITRAFRWNAVGGMRELNIPEGYYSSHATGVSANGAVAIGWASPTPPNTSLGVRWTPAFQALSTLGGSEAQPIALSENGSVIVGWSKLANGQTRACRWVNGNVQDLGTLGGTYSQAIAVSADGTKVGGHWRNDALQTRSFIWTPENGMQDIGFFAVEAFSADFATAVGSNVSSNAFRWTATGGVRPLGTLGGSTSWGHVVSADGTVVAGESRTASARTHPARWVGDVFPVVSTQPQNAVVCAGESASLTVSAQSISAMTYRWRKNSVVINSGSGGNPSAATNTLTLNDVSLSDAASYDCVVSNDCGSTTSAAATLTVNLAPRGSIEPPEGFVSVCDGGTFTMRAFATGTGPFTFQWFQNQNQMFDNDRVTGTNTDTLTIRSIQNIDLDFYLCSITNSCGEILLQGPWLTLCRPDFNCDDVVDFFDYLDFVDAFSEGSMQADFNDDQVVDFFDYLDFVQEFSTGC